MSDIRVSVFARTDIGMQRSGNEDAFLVADLTTGNVGLGPDMSTHSLGARGSLMVVSDGMGGAVAGEIASEMAVTSIRESLMEMPPDLSISDQLKLATEIANERIWNHAQQNPELSGMGATVTAVLVQGTTAYIGQVGDSRAYLVRGDRIKQLTKDQSLAQMLVDSGAITPEQISSVPQNVIMQALGTQPTVKVALTAVELCRNDHLLICSDGLSNKIQASEMREAAQSSADLTAACRRLVEVANERGGEDNITVIIAKFDGEALQTGTDSSSITGSFKSLNQDYYTERGPAPGATDHSASDRQSSVTTQLASPMPPSPPDKETTTLVMSALPSSVGMDSQETPLDGSPAVAEPVDEQPTLERPAFEPPSFEHPAHQQPSAHQQSSFEPEPVEHAAVTARLGAPEVATTTTTVRRRKSYVGILLFGLFSILLILAAGYFYYVKIWKPRQQQQQQQVVPIETQQQEPAPDGEPPPPNTSPSQGQESVRPPDAPQSDASQPQSQTLPNANKNN